MKFSGIFALTISSFLLINSVSAQEASFDIGGSDTSTRSVVTDKMIASSREKAAENVNEVFHSNDNPIIGNPNGSMTLVEFMDYHCSNSRDIDPNVLALLHSNPNLRIVYKEFPIHGDISVYAAKAALAANNQGKFLPFHIALMHAGKNLSTEKVLALAAKSGLDVAQLKLDMNSSNIENQVANMTSLARSLNIPGTPGLFFAKSSIANDASSDDVFFMLGKFSQKDLQQAINYINKK